MIFRYEILRGKKKIKGFMECADVKEVEEKLKKAYGGRAKIKIRKSLIWIKRKGKVSDTVKMLFYRQLEAMIKCGIPLPDVLKLSAASIPEPAFALSVLNMENEVLQGQYLHSAMEKEGYFNDVEKALVAAGEESASLDVIFRRLYDYFKDVFKIKSKIKESLVYPMCIVIVMIAVLLIASRLIMPKFIDIYENVGTEMPLLTAIVLEVFGRITYLLPFLVILGVIIYLIISRAIKKEKYRWKWDKFILGLPKIGDILITSYWVEILRALEVLISAGVDLHKSLQHAETVATRLPIKKVLEDAANAVLSGRMLYASLQRDLNYVSPLVVGMIAAGENSGSLEHMFASTAEYLEDELSHKISLFMKFLEPALIIAIGIIVGIVVFALYLPIFTLASKI
jgi:type II secretory pathway component PulF